MVVQHRHECYRCGYVYWRDSPAPSPCPNPGCSPFDVIALPDRTATPTDGAAPPAPIYEKVMVRPSGNRHPTPFQHKYVPRAKKRRDWSKYGIGRRCELGDAPVILAMALDELGLASYRRVRGRPPTHLKDKLQLMVNKAMQNRSYWHSDGWIDALYHRRLITKVVHPYSIPDFMRDPAITRLLLELIGITSLPFAAIERSASVDGTGLGTPEKKRWVDVRLDPKEAKDYCKLHLLVGNTTHIIIGARVTDGTTHDTTQFIPLLEAAQEFKLQKICADAAYTNRANANATRSIGAKPYFDIKRNMNLKTREISSFGGMIREFRDHTQLYLEEYHERSQIEAVNSSIKQKVAGSVLSKHAIAQVNEALCVAVAYNLQQCAHYSKALNLKLTFKRKKSKK